MTIIISENSLIGREGSKADFCFPNVVFDALKHYVITTAPDGIAQYLVQQRQEFVRIKNHVGLLQISNELGFEILPKICDDRVAARAVLIQMFRQIHRLPFKKLPLSNLSVAKIPLWEIFIGLFLDELANVTQKGLQSSYQWHQQKTTFLRGRWLVEQQLKHGAALPIHFFVEQDHFTDDIQPNRMLKTCLKVLDKRSQIAENQKKIVRLSRAFERISETTDFKYLPLGSGFSHYESVLEWAQIILNQQSWLGQAGVHSNLSLLFPTEQLFENYVSEGFKRYFADYEVNIQKNEQYLVQDNEGKHQFRLRPDVVLRKEGKTFVFDAKWKTLDSNHAQTHGIDQRDLYQVYVYGKKYKADNLFLIYPAYNPSNIAPLSYRFDEALSLQIWPLNLAKSLGHEMARLKEKMEI